MSIVLCVIDNVRMYESSFVEKTFGTLESTRLLGIKNERRRAESLAGLVALRDALGDRAAGDIERDGRGRPGFAGSTEIDFSISHSGKISVAALIDSPLGRIGVDIERIDEKKEDTHKRIADRYFSKEEISAFEASGDSLEFYKIWTTKEARAKFFGIGLAEILSAERSFEKNDCNEYLLMHFLLTYKGESYMLTVCVNREEKLDFICGRDMTLVPVDISK